jgi:hypothetical protein
MSPEQIDKMLKMHRYLMKCEIRHAFDVISQNESSARIQEEVNNKNWDDFAKWFKVMRDE